MRPLAARDVLSDGVMRVAAEARRSASESPIYAVFAAGPYPQFRSFLGLVNREEVVRYPTRIFADLLPQHRPQPLAAETRRAAESLGGRVGLEASPGQGSRFWVELPRADYS